MNKKLLKAKRAWQLYLLLALPVIYLLIFNYGPMYGIQIAFRNYTPAKGIIGSDWVGLKWFEQFLSHYEFKQIFANTLIISLYSLVVGFPLPIIFALLLNAIEKKKFVRFTQTVSYMPHFISVVILVSIINLIFSPVCGLYGNFYRLLGGDGFPFDIRSAESSFRHLYVWSGIWQQLGWDSIIYMSALSSVSGELHDAAKIDGATRLQRIIHIDLPAIMPTIMILLIMRCGHLVSVGFQKVYLMQSPLNMDVSEVISTYIYRAGMRSFSKFSYGAAVGLFNTAINLTLLVIVNTISRKTTENEVSLF